VNGAVQVALITARPSHFTSVGFAGAAAVAGAVAATLGGDDTDTVACMAGSIAGAFSGFVAVPRDKYAQVLEANPIDIADVAKRLYETVR